MVSEDARECVVYPAARRGRSTAHQSSLPPSWTEDSIPSTSGRTRSISLRANGRRTVADLIVGVVAEVRNLLFEDRHSRLRIVDHRFRVRMMGEGFKSGVLRSNRFQM